MNDRNSAVSDSAMNLVISCLMGITLQALFIAEGVYLVKAIADMKWVL